MSERPTLFYAVMIPQRFSDMESSNTVFNFPMRVQVVPGSPDWYIPLFETREDAERWNGGPDGIAVMGNPPAD